MKIKYDPKAKAAYIHLRDGEGFRAISVTHECNIDLNSAGEILGIELMGELVSIEEKEAGSFGERLANIEVSVYNTKQSALGTLQALTDEEVGEVLSDVLESILQEGREIGSRKHSV